MPQGGRRQQGGIGHSQLISLLVYCSCKKKKPWWFVPKAITNDINTNTTKIEDNEYQDMDNHMKKKKKKVQ